MQLQMATYGAPASRRQLDIVFLDPRDYRTWMLGIQAMRRELEAERRLTALSPAQVQFAFAASPHPSPLTLTLTLTLPLPPTLTPTLTRTRTLTPTLHPHPGAIRLWLLPRSGRQLQRPPRRQAARRLYVARMAH